MNECSVPLRRAVIGVLALATAPAFSQQVSQSSELRSIETIVITSQKREQSLQDVPIVVTTLGEQQLRDTGVRDIKELMILTPGLLVGSTVNESVTTARIRGVGTVGDNPGLESSVGILIDGVYRPRNGVGFGDLGEVERIEVLKGPQGTLFGKNTSAGVISVVTKKPSFDHGVEAEVGGGEYGGLEGSLAVTGPIEDDLVAGRLYVAARERDGYLDIIRGGGPRVEDEDDDRKFYTGKGQILLLPNDTTDIRLSVDYTERDENCCGAPQVIAAPPIQTLNNGTLPLVQIALNATQPNSFAMQPDPFQRVAYANRSTQQSITDRGVMLEANVGLPGGATMTSITAARNWEIVSGQDTDFTAVDIVYREPDGDFSNEFDQLSQELRFAGDTERLNWLVGVFYTAEDMTSNNELLLGNQFQQYFSRLLNPNDPNVITNLTGNRNAFQGGLGQQDVFEQESTTYAVFTNNSLQITDGLTATLGANYTDQTKDLDTQYRNTNGGVGCQALRNQFNIINGNANLRAAIPTIYGVGCTTLADPLFNNVTTTQSRDEQEWSGTAKLAYRFSDDVMSYVSYARGYKAGGFNFERERLNDNNLANVPALGPLIAVDTDTSFGRELVDSYELGTKTQWANNSLLLNAAVFYQDFTNFQLNTFTGLQFVVTSLPQVVSQGVDLDMLWYTPLRQLTLQGGVTYAETTIEDFGTSLVFFRPERQDDTLSFAPELSASLLTTFEQPIGSFVFRTILAAKYTSDYNTGSNLDPRKIQDAFTLLNVRLGFGNKTQSWMVELWANNVTDEEYFQVAFDAALQGSSTGAMPTSMIDAFLGAPRTFGATARFKF